MVRPNKFPYSSIGCTIQEVSCLYPGSASYQNRAGFTMHDSDDGQEGAGPKLIVPLVRAITILAILGVGISMVLYFLPVLWAGSTGSFVLATPFPVMNESYPIYRTVPPNTSHEEIQRIGNLLGVSGDVIEPRSSSDAARIVDNSTSPPAELQYNLNSGAFEYSIPEKKYPATAHSQPDLPSDEETRKIATDYLQERGLLPEDVHFDSVGVQSRIGSGTPYSHVVYDMTKHVSFFKEIRGFRVYHAGIGVTLGEHGEVVAAGSNIRDFYPEPDRYVTILTPQQAYQRLCANDLVIRPKSSPGIHVVSNISLGYWMEVRSSPQEYILPVYAFTCDGSEGGIVTWYVWATDPSEMQALT